MYNSGSNIVEFEKNRKVWQILSYIFKELLKKKENYDRICLPWFISSSFEQRKHSHWCVFIWKHKLCISFPCSVHTNIHKKCKMFTHFWKRFPERNRLKKRQIKALCYLCYFCVIFVLFPRVLTCKKIWKWLCILFSNFWKNKNASLLMGPNSYWRSRYKDHYTRCLECLTSV